MLLLILGKQMGGKYVGLRMSEMSNRKEWNEVYEGYHIEKNPLNLFQVFQSECVTVVMPHTHTTPYHLLFYIMNSQMNLI